MPARNRLFFPFLLWCSLALAGGISAPRSDASLAPPRAIARDAPVRVEAATPPSMFSTPNASSVAADYYPTCGTLCAFATPFLWGYPATNVQVLDYFTLQPVLNVTYIVDGTPSMKFPSTLSAGLHSLVVITSDYAVYHNGITGGDNATILLFPVSGAMMAWVTQVNLDRQANGVINGLMSLDNQLTIAAFYHAGDMAKYNYFAHVDPFQGLNPTQRVQRLGENVGAGENIAAAGSWQSAEAAFMSEKQWLANQDKSDCPTTLSNAGYQEALKEGKSPAELVGHFCNIVTPGYGWIGLGIAPNQYVQDFMYTPGTTDPLQAYPGWTTIPDRSAPLVHLPDFYETTGLAWEAFQ